MTMNVKTILGVGYLFNRYASILAQYCWLCGLRTLRFLALHSLMNDFWASTIFELRKSGKKIYFILRGAKLLQEIRSRFTLIVPYWKQNDNERKNVSEVGYLSIDVLWFWHSTVDCASFRFLPEFPLLLRVLTPFWLLASGIGRL